MWNYIGIESNPKSLHISESSIYSNDGRGKASDLAVKRHFVSADSAGSTHAHSDSVAQGGSSLAAANKKNTHGRETTGESSMIIDDEGEKNDKVNEDGCLVTLSGGMNLSSTEDGNDQHSSLLPPPPHPPSRCR